MPEELSRNRFDVILQHDWSIEQWLLHIRVFSAGKRRVHQFCSFHPLADKTNNEHLPEPFFKDIRKSLYMSTRNHSFFVFRFVGVGASVISASRVTENPI